MGDTVCNGIAIPVSCVLAMSLFMGYASHVITPVSSVLFSLPPLSQTVWSFIWSSVAMLTGRQSRRQADEKAQKIATLEAENARLKEELLSTQTKLGQADTENASMKQK